MLNQIFKSNLSIRNQNKIKINYCIVCNFYQLETIWTTNLISIQTIVKILNKFLTLSNLANWINSKKKFDL